MVNDNNYFITTSYQTRFLCSPFKHYIVVEVVLDCVWHELQNCFTSLNVRARKTNQVHIII